MSLCFHFMSPRVNYISFDDNRILEYFYHSTQKISTEKLKVQPSITTKPQTLRQRNKIPITNTTVEVFKNFSDVMYSDSYFYPMI